MVDDEDVIARRPEVHLDQVSPHASDAVETDPTLSRVVSWLIDRQLPDGSIPLIVSSAQGETGQTSRTLKALGRLQDAELAERLEAMCNYLLGTAIEQPIGAAWAYSRLHLTVVTGSTSLAVTALVQQGIKEEVVHQGLRFLLAAQERNGGWSEVPGFRPTVQNTFQAVRAIRAAQQAGILEEEEATSALDQARQWFLGTVSRRPPRSILEHSFAVRTAVQLDLLRNERVEGLARQLSRRRRQFLDTAADMYADTEIAAIALTESSQRLDAMPDGRRVWQWRWQLPALAPPFLARGAYFYELLYGAFKSRWWVFTVDALIQNEVIDRIAALLLGIVTALGVVDDSVSNALLSGQSPRAPLTVAAIGALLLLWLGVKTAARASILRSLSSSVGSLLAALALTGILYTSAEAFAALLSLVGLRWLVIDIVAFTADSTGLLDRLLPKR